MHAVIPEAQRMGATGAKWLFNQVLPEVVKGLIVLASSIAIGVIVN
jgi:ABC-type dipeptide/oligopeptide/nickel transport system permease subunit